MCGIVGGIGSKVFETVQENINLLEKRGPDNQNILTFPNGLVFGATRLAMTDPHPRSNQPMVDEMNGNAIVFNGEIYNYEHIRNKLILNGIKFHTNSDTEVLLKALSYLGSEIIPNLEGMYSFVFFNARLNKLVLCRDYLGKKPLYFYAKGSKVFFSSQLNFMRKYISTANLSLQSIQTYLRFGYVIDPYTMYDEINSIKPGEILEIDLKVPKISKSSNFIPEAVHQKNGGNLNDIFQNALLDRVKGHEDKLALSLSGGVDSTIIALECAKLKLPLDTYSLSWSSPDKEKYNVDSIAAEKIAFKLGLNFRKIEMPKGNYIPKILDEFVIAMGEPNANPTGLSMMHLYSKISEEGHRLVLTGDGADEIFGGYPRYEKVNMLRNYAGFEFKSLSKIISKKNPNLNFLYKFLVAVNNNDSDMLWNFFHADIGAYHLRKLGFGFQNVHPKFFGSELRDKFSAPNEKLARLMYKDLRTWLSMESNRKLDRVSMSYSIEARSPFQSEKVIHFGYQAFGSPKFQYSSKELLFKSFPLVNSLPINTNKSGFISPLGDWLRSNSALIFETIDNLPKYLPLEKKELRRLAKAPAKGNFLEIKLLWSLIVLDRWILNR